jgi:putative tricarboxylic transport membrane protein
MTVDISLLVLFTVVGSFVGTIIGMLPGLGSAATLAILLPLIIQVPPLYSIPIMAAIYYGSQYGGSTTSILFKIPGEISGAVICTDGHLLYQQGRAYQALKIAAYGSFFAGIITTAVIYGLSHLLLPFVTFFGPSELFVLSVIGLGLSTVGMGYNKWLVVASASAGMLLSFVGINDVSGALRYSFEITYLYDGLSLAIIIAGLFGGAEVLNRILNNTAPLIKINKLDISSEPLSRDEKKSCAKSIGRGTVTGAVVGLIPGGGALLASVFAYALEKIFVPGVGTGKLEAVAGPESANNAAAQSGFVPLFVLGIPENVILSMIFGIMMFHGIPIGYGFLDGGWLYVVLLSMLLGNAILLILNLPLIRFFLHIYQIPDRVINILIVAVLVVGIYSIHQQIADVVVLIGSSLVGLALKKADIPILPMVMGFVLGPYVEDRFVKSMLISNGDAGVFLDTAVFQLATAVMILVLVVKIWKKIKTTWV